MYELERAWSTGRICSLGVGKAGGCGGEIETHAVYGDSYELHADVRLGGVDDM